MWDVKIKKKKCLQKTIIQYNIYVIRQFVYVHKIAVISLFLKKNIRCKGTIFLFQNNTTNLNLKQLMVFIFYIEKPPLHGLSLKKSLIKNCNTFI